MAPGWLGSWPASASRWWSWTVRAGQLVAMVPSPTRWMRSAPDVKRWAVIASPSLGPAATTGRAGMLLAARRSAVGDAIAAQGQLQAMVVAASEGLRGPVARTLPPGELDRATAPDCVAMHGGTSSAAPPPRRCEGWPDGSESGAEAEDAPAGDRDRRAGGPTCSTELGVGPIVAATVLCAWSHPGRCAPKRPSPCSPASRHPGSSGQTTRHRLNRRGDRQLNRALHIIGSPGCDTTPPPGLRRPTTGRGQDRPGDPPVPHWSSIRCAIRMERVVLLGERPGTASLPCRQTASLSSAAPGAPRPADRLQGHAPARAEQ